MKIGFNARYFAEPHTGLGQYSLNLYAALTANYPDTHFLLYLPDGCARPPFPGRNWEAVFLKGKADADFDRSFTRQKGFNTQRPDLLHLPHLRLPDETADIPTLLTIHDMIPAVFLRWKRLLSGKTPWSCISALGLQFRLLEPKRIRKADRICTISNHSARDIAGFLKRPRETIAVIPNGIDPNFGGNATPEIIHAIKEKYGIRGRYLISFGGQTVRKNLNRQLKAFRQIRRMHHDLQFLVTGEGQWQKKMLRKKIPGLLLPGRIPEKEMAALIAGATASLYLSLYEGFGLPILESLACGTAVLTSRESAMSEILPECTYRANPFSVQDIRSSLLKMLEDPDECEKKVRAAGPGLVDFSWERTAESYMALFRQTVANGGRG